MGTSRHHNLLLAHSAAPRETEQVEFAPFNSQLSLSIQNGVPPDLRVIPEAEGANRLVESCRSGPAPLLG